MPTIHEILSDSYSTPPTLGYNAFALADSTGFHCQTDRHRDAGVRADVVAFIFEQRDAENPLDRVVVHQAWYECHGCRNHKLARAAEAK